MTEASKGLAAELFERNSREGGYIFVTAPLFPGWSYMLHPRENDNSLYQSLAIFAAMERALRPSTKGQ